MFKQRRYCDKIIKDNIDYDALIHCNPDVDIDGIVEIMLDAICSNREYLYISSDEIPQEVVKSRLLKLNYEHIEYAIECLKRTKHVI